MVRTAPMGAASLRRYPFLTPHARHKRVKEVNTMAPLYTLLLCLPAALVLIACGGGLAALWSPTARPTTHQTASKQQAGATPHETARK